MKRYFCNKMNNRTKQARNIFFFSMLFFGTLQLSATENDKYLNPENYDGKDSQGVIQESGTPIKGIVKDDRGEALMGVSVLIRETTLGTITDLEGNFNLTVPAGKRELEVSYLGFKTQIVPIGNNTTFNITLSEDSKLLGEVVVTAMGIERKSASLTYSTDVLAGKELTRSKETNLINSLQGKSAGLVITPNASGAGGSSKILLRGNKSAQGNNQPLIVIDGIPMASPKTEQQSSEFGGRDGGDAISNLNPDDIASINILKGASAAALYGSMASNGVILVTTKKGREGDVRIDFSSNTTFETPLILPELQSTYGAILTGDQLSAKSWGDKISGGTPGADRVDDFYRTGTSLINSISLNGGTEKAQSYLSYANTTALGIIPTNDFYRHNIMAKQTFKLFKDRLEINGSVNYITQKGTNRPHGGTYFNPLTGLYSFPANGDFKYYKDNYEVFDPVRNLNAQNWYTETNDFAQNPYWILNRNQATEKRDRIIASGSAKFNITDYLNIQGRLSLDKTEDLYEMKVYATTTSVLAPTNGRYTRSTFGAKQLYGDLMLHFNKTYDKFEVSASAGTSFTDYKTNKLNIDSDKLGLVIPNFFVPENMLSNPINRTEAPRKRLNSVFGTAQIGYNEMVYFDVTGRNDWSSTLAYTDNMSYFYPSFGLTLLLNNMVSLPEQINLLKLRGSYSIVGNDMPAYITYPMEGFNLGALEPNVKAPFSEMKPEKMHSMEFGFDLGMLDSRLYLDFTYYKTNNKNQYFSIKAPSGSGYESLYINTGNIQNEGFESSISYRMDFNKDWSWRTGANVSYNNNTIKELDPKLGNYVTIGEGAGFRFILKEGGSYGDIYTRKLMRDENGVISVDDKGNPIRSDEYEYVGNVNSKWNLGWNNTINYKEFSLYFLLDGKIGGKTVSMTQSMLDSYGVTKATADARNNGGVPRGDGSMIDAQKYYEAVGGRDGAGAEYVYSATNFRLRELSLGYTFRNLIGPSKDLGLSLIARNLFMIYKDAPHDPDMSMSTENGYQGFDIFSMPATRSYGLNLKLTF